MQQSSQIYVFSTGWANRGAEAVMQDQFPSIVAWHESQPETKKHMEVGTSTISPSLLVFTIDNSGLDSSTLAWLGDRTRSVPVS